MGATGGHGLVRFGVTIPNNWGIADPGQVLAMGPLAESLGYDSVWVMDHLLNSGYIRERLDDRPYYHPLATLSYLAATTRRVSLGTSVMVLPYHNPVELAKYAATLDQMSGGRLILGVGAGAMTQEFDALGVPFRQRGALTNECMAIMKELWTSPDPSYRSERWNLAGFKFAPKPAQRPSIPLWVGGSSAGALRRAATLGDGWHPTGMSAEAFEAGRREVRAQAAAAGRDPANLAMSIRVEVEVDGKPSSQRVAGRARLAGDSPEQMIAGIRAYERAGVEHVVLALNSGDMARITALMVDIAQKVIPQCRQPQGSCQSSGQSV
jgi:probable F420-dependent oxidoreductase